MQPIQRAELIEENWIFLGKSPCGRPEEGGAGARIAAEKEELSDSTWDFWHKFLPTYT